MGRKKRKAAQVKPFCYYCDREFDDEKVLIQHQKAKHFKCSLCNRKLDTATGLIVHMLQVHKETISKVPNAITNRDNPELIVHGLAGVPMELINEKQAKLDAERGSVKQQKTAHTVFGMSVMNGFFNQMNAAGMPGFVGATQGVPALTNPVLFNQLMSQFTQNSNLLASKLPVTPPMMPMNNQPSFPGNMMIPAAGAPVDLNKQVTTPVSRITPTETNWTLKPAANAVGPSILKTDITIPGITKTSQLVYELPDEEVSVEELLAEHYGYKRPDQATVVP